MADHAVEILLHQLPQAMHPKGPAQGCRYGRLVTLLTRSGIPANGDQNPAFFDFHPRKLIALEFAGCIRNKAVAHYVQTQQKMATRYR
jgi:hypothetical protein